MEKSRLAWVLLAWLTLSSLLAPGCSLAPLNDAPAGPRIPKIPFTYFGNTFVVLPVLINGIISTKFILDSGVGATLISRDLCDRIDCLLTGKHSGKRMSGQPLSFATTSVHSIELGNLNLADVAAGVFELDRLMPGSGIDGFLSLDYFKANAFTVDYKSQTVAIEDPVSLRQIKGGGSVVVPLRLVQDGLSLDAFLSLVLPNGTMIEAEVDMGSQELILDERFMAAFGLTPSAPNVRVRKGEDETGHPYHRYFATIPGLVHLPGQDVPSGTTAVMFQKIIYDGLAGHDFLKQFTVTYDLPHAEMIFRKP